MVRCYVGVLFRHFLEGFGVHVAPIAQGIAFGHDAHLAFAGFTVQSTEVSGAAFFGACGGSQAGLLEAIADNPVGRPAGEYFHLGSHFIRCALTEPPALANVLALAVFSNHQHVDVFGALIRQILTGTGKQSGGPFANPLIKSLAHVQQGGQGDAVWQQVTVRVVDRAGVAQGTQQNRIIGF